jgi:peptidyl-prolyl cis-trans isomerase D
MLTIMRKGASSGFMKIILFGMLLFAVAGMIFMDVSGYLSRGVTSTHVATIDGESFPADMFDRDAQRIVLRQNGMDMKTAYHLGYINQILDAEISSRLMQREAIDLGFYIGNDIVLDQINAIVSPYAQDAAGRKEATRRLLQQQGMSEEEFVNAIRTEMQRVILQNAVAGATGFVPPEESADLYSYLNESRAVRAFVLKDADIKDIPASGDEVLLPLYQAGHEKYAVPETRAFTLAVLKKDDQPIPEISDDAVRKAYDADLPKYTTGETRELDMAVFGEEANAQKVVDFLKSGSTLTLKEATAHIVGNDKPYMGDSSYQKEGMAEVIATPAFAARKGEAVGPIKTGLGWHVIVVKDITGSKVQPYEEVRGQIRKELMQEQEQENLMAKADDIDTRITAGDPLEDIAKENGMTLAKFGPIRDDGSTADSKEGVKGYDKDRDTLVQAAFDQLEGESSQMIELSDGDYAIVRVDQINEKSYRSFEDVKPEIAAQWQKDQQGVLNAQRAKDIVAELAAGKSLDAAAAGLKAQVSAYEIKRSGAPPAPLTQPAVARLFDTPKGGFAAVPVPDGVAVAEVTSITSPDAAKATETQLKAVAETAKKSVQGEFNALYLNYLQRKYHVTVNNAMLKRMYGGGEDDASAAD